jgi:plasmid stabilization system protein ParE
LIGEEREDLAPGVRQFTVRQRVIFYIYEEASDTVQILRVLDGARDAASELRKSGMDVP